MKKKNHGKIIKQSLLPHTSYTIRVPHERITACTRVSYTQSLDDDDKILLYNIKYNACTFYCFRRIIAAAVRLYMK